MRWRSMLLMAATACGSGPGPGAPSPEFQSGTRLRARVDQAGDARLFVGWHDAQLGVDCDWMLADHGEVRCLPADRDGRIVYADDQCTQPLYEHSACTPPPAMFLRESTIENCTAPEVDRLGDEVAAPATIYVPTPSRPDDPDAPPCRPTSSATPMTYHAVAGAVAPEAFVAARYAPEPRGDRLDADVLRGSDGSIDARRLRDTARHMHCDPRLIGEPWNRCTPHFVDVETAWTDCEATRFVVRLAVMAHDAFCPQIPEASGNAYLDTAGRPQGQYAEIGGEHVGASYQFFSESCFPVPGTFFELGKMLDATAFAPLSSIEEGAGRTRAIASLAAGGERLRADEFVDDVAGACAARVATDGLLRCLPPPAAFTGRTLYLDPACTARVLEQPAEAPPPRMTTSDDGPACSVTSHVLGVASAPIPASAIQLYQLDDHATCITVGAVPAFSYYATTGEIAPEMFAPITRAVE